MPRGSWTTDGAVRDHIRQLKSLARTTWHAPGTKSPEAEAEGIGRELFRLGERLLERRRLSDMDRERFLRANEGPGTGRPIRA